MLNDAEIVQFMECFGFKFDVFSFEKVAFCSAILRWTGTTSAGFDRLHFAYPKMKRLNLALLMAGKTNRGDVKSFGRTGKKSIRTESQLWMRN
jgi:hypothetical protein